ncbi:IclR family transcriptional regulator [Nocardioides sp. HDW12B]|uniref:IclR family transcriptional regulator n=1 Tax=Nocardioides sp. HDW12B TaxID=2714939 RepID=UPI00140BA44C|nr:IclR family transcriptional regulator [Nocardioides sp. HDW12B]QIK67169.1 IclR family transcriptional regulator [Nocardioides sp. HDW12B]
MPGPETVLGKAAALLFAFGPDEPQLSLSELTARTGVAKPTVHRVAGDLVALRLLERVGSDYRLGARLFELGMRASVERGLLEVATPFLQDVRERTRETVHLAVPEGTEVVYVAKLGDHQQASTPTRLGGRMPMHCTALGKALLAHTDPEVRDAVLAGPLERRTARTVVAPGLLHRQLERVRASGVAFEHEEAVAGVVCVAAPVLGVDDRPVAAVSATGPITRFDPTRHAAAVRAAADGIAATLARRRELTPEVHSPEH